MEYMISMLDAMDGDPDLEPDLSKNSTTERLYR
jgi:hypothetical protein